jgi:catechol 2,3-dioxygenase-like lactoylglutathione lyase family enzyme
MDMASFRYMVSDVDAAVAFYTTLLDFELEEQFGPAMAIVRRNDATLWLAGPSSSAARPMPDGSQPVPGGWNRIVIEVEDIAASVERMRSSGVLLRNEIVTGPGGKQVLVEDPSGNPIELFQPLR